MCFATGVDPTKLTASTSSWDRSWLTVSAPPLIRLTTPFGNPASFINLIMNSGADGFRSEGLRIKVFPQAMALGNIHKGTMTGKLKGVIPTHTPTG